MNKVIQDAINDQIRAELESAYLYLAMAARFEERNLSGFARWFRLQWQEETAHALKFYDFLLHRDGSVELQALARPAVEFDTPLEAFRQVLEHEQYITRRIHELYELSVEQKDYPLQPLLHWFIDEQVEEEQSAKDIIARLELIGNTGTSMYLMDRELGQRSSAS